MVARLRDGPAQSGAGGGAAGPGFLAAAHPSCELRGCCEPLYKLGFSADLCLFERLPLLGGAVRTPESESAFPASSMSDVRLNERIL